MPSHFLLVCIRIIIGKATGMLALTIDLVKLKSKIVELLKKMKTLNTYAETETL